MRSGCSITLSSGNRICIFSCSAFNFCRFHVELKMPQCAISHLEKLLQKETQNNTELKPMTMKEFQKRMDQSTEDSQNRRLTENSKLISEIEKWS